MDDLASVKLPQKKAHFNKTNKLLALYCPQRCAPVLKDSVKLLSNVVSKHRENEREKR